MKLAGAVVVAVCLAPIAHAEPGSEPFADEMKAAFAKVQKPGKLPWAPRLSPPFPDAGPGRQPVVLRYYAYAASLAPGLSDGEHVAGVWALGRLAGKSSFDVTAGRLVELGVQGVRPMTAEEVAAMKSASSMRGLLEELAMFGGDKRELEPRRQKLRPYYCTWKKLNGVIAKEIVEQQTAFFAWLACD